MELARLGDTIECDVTNPLPATLRARLDTPEAVAMGNELLFSGSDWRLKPAIPIKRSFSCGVGNCGGGKCIHKLLDEQCPVCRSNMVEVTTTGHKFCCNDDQACDYETT